MVLYCRWLMCVPSRSCSLKVVYKEICTRLLPADSELPDSAGGTTPLTTSLADFLDLLVEGIKNSDFEISGRVDISDSAFGSTDGSQIANGIAQIIGNYTKFRWT